MKRLAGTGFLAVILLALGIVFAVSRQAPSPDQPIAFNHKIHAGDYKIACEYCHIYARKAAVAGIPSVQRCMGCHKITAADNPGVQRLKGYWDKKEPIQWNRLRGCPSSYISSTGSMFGLTLPVRPVTVPLKPWIRSNRSGL